MGKAASKALKFVAIAASIVAAVPTLGASLGVSALLLTGVAAAAALGSSLLAPKPKPPQSSPESANRLFTSIDPRTPRKIVFGQTAMATDIRDQEYTGNQDYFHRFVVVASHKVQSIDEIWFDDKRVWTVAGGVEGDAVGYLSVTPILEGSAANAINISPRMGSTRRYTGCAYVHLRFKLTGNSKKTESPYAQSVPTRVTVRGKGAFLYDPRKDSTAGGSGSHRANDQSTWEWSDSGSRNPALQELWYELGWRINGKLAVGKGVPPERLDLASYIVAANLCDEAVALAAGGTEPRYRSDGVFSEGDQPSLVRDNLKAAMNAVLDDMDGKIRLTVISNDLASPIADFTEADVIDGVRWDQTPPLVDTFNVIRGGFTDPSDQSLYQLVDYPEIALPSVDGIERVESVDFPLVQSPSQAQRLAKQRLQRMQYPGILTANFQATAWRVQKGDVIRLTFPALGWNLKLFRVIDITVRVDGVVPMVLREEHASIYAWSASEAAPVTAAAPTSYDWTKNPIYADIAALEDVSAAYTFRLTNEYEGLAADQNGNVIDYGPATTGLQVLYGAQDVTSQFAPVALVSGDGRNPQGLALSGTYPNYAVVSGFDANEDNAKFVFRVAGTGAHAGVTLDSTFSIGKTKAGANGTSPPLISLEVAPLVFVYDGEGVIKPQEVRLHASRSAPLSGDTRWRLLKADETVITDRYTAATFAGILANGTAAPDNDTIILNQAGFDAITSYHNTPGLIFEVSLHTDTSVSDRQGLVAVTDGEPGQDGEPGANGYTVSPSRAAILVAAFYNGDLKPDQLPLPITISAAQGGSDISGAIGVSATATTGLAVSTSANVVSLTDASNDGTVTITVTHAGATIATIKVPVSRKLDPAPPQSATGVSNNFVNTVATDTYGVETSKSVLLQAGASGTISASLSGQYNAGGPGSTRSVTVAAKLRYRLPAGSWSDFGAEFAGSAASFSADGPEPGEIDGAQTASGLTSGQTYEIEGFMRVSARNAGSTTASISGVLAATTS